MTELTLMRREIEEIPEATTRLLAQTEALLASAGHALKPKSSHSCRSLLHRRHGPVMKSLRPPFPYQQQSDSLQ